MDSIVGKLDQLGMRLRILTYLGLHEESVEGDPFLLTSVRGSEGISQPFSFRLEMHRDPNRAVYTAVGPGQYARALRTIRIRKDPYGS